MLDDFEDDNDLDINAELSIPHVIAGLLMLIFGLALLLFYLENIYLKYLCFLIFISSFFVMTKRKK